MHWVGSCNNILYITINTRVKENNSKTKERSYIFIICNGLPIIKLTKTNFTVCLSELFNKTHIYRIEPFLDLYKFVMDPTERILY